MKRIATLLFALAGFGAASAVEAGERRIALTFDDSPTPDSSIMTGAERTERLLAALKRAGVEQAAFFVVGKNVEAAGGKKRVASFVAHGHAIANHSFSHEHLKTSDAGAYLADIDRNEAALSSFANRRPWFRFPFLDEGKDEAQRDAVRAGLAARGLSNGYVSVDTYDWYLAGLLERSAAAGACVSETALRKLYVDVIVGAADFYDDLAVKTLGRSPAHVILLHENDIAALYIEDLAKALRADGWTIVTADEAFADPISSAEPATMFLGQGRIAAMAREKGAPATDLVSEFEDEEALDARFAKAAAIPCEKAAP